MGDWVERRAGMEGGCRRELSKLLKPTNLSLLPYRKRVIAALAHQLADARSKTDDPYWGGVGDDVSKGFLAALDACNKPVQGWAPPSAFAGLLAHLDEAAETFRRTEIDADGFGFGTIAKVARNLRRDPFGMVSEGNPASQFSYDGDRRRRCGAILSRSRSTGSTAQVAEVGLVSSDLQERLASDRFAGSHKSRRLD